MNDEAALLKAAKRLNRDALVAIFDMYASAIYKYAMRLCHDPIEADHIVGDVFVQLMEKLAVGQGPVTNLRSYLYQIAYHLVVDRARSNHRFVPLRSVADVHERSVEPAIQSQVEDRAIMEALIFSMNTELSEIQRHVIILRFLEAFSLRETADILGKKVNHIKVIQNRAITKLRNCLGLEVEHDLQERST
jgi:RNA polymerase sigma-70 factor (ECF subfamily)